MAKVSSKRPKISANKLGEYITSGPSRRRTIVKDQKYPSGFIVTRYNDARKGIIDFFTKGKGDKKMITKKIESLILKSYPTVFRNQDNQLSIVALEIFSKSAIDSQILSHTLERYSGERSKLQIDGVDVSIHPEVLIRGSIRGKEFIGAIKLHISKSNPLSSDEQKYVATLLHRFLEKNYPEDNVSPDFCVSMDIFTGSYSTAPRKFKNLRKDIEAACGEIRLIWADL